VPECNFNPDSGFDICDIMASVTTNLPAPYNKPLYLNWDYLLLFRESIEGSGVFDEAMATQTIANPTDYLFTRVGGGPAENEIYKI